MNQPDPIKLLRTGLISPSVACARLLLEGLPTNTILERLRPVIPLNEEAITEDKLSRLRAMIDALSPDHAQATTPAQVAALFDRAAALWPEAGVALYTLGDPQSLRAASQEIAGWLRARGLIRPGMDVLDLGCGIGRMTEVLAGAVGSVTGVDVSPVMLREAERRCAGLANVRFQMTSGENLEVWPDAAFDLILAVDTFPYLVQAGVAERHVADCARLLKNDGWLVVLNLSYRGDAVLDRQDAETWADRYRLLLQEAGQPFRLWDGSAWLFHRM